MANPRNKRLEKELAILKEDSDGSGVIARVIDDSDITHLKGIFSGPPDTPYAGGTFQVDIKIPDDYPFQPPKFNMDTKIWHPNISSKTGMICLDIIKASDRNSGGDTNNWTPVTTIKTVLISLRMLLENPNPDDPQDAVVAHMAREEPEYFRIMAHDWAVRYAGAPRREPPPDETPRKPAPAPVKKIEEIDPSRYKGYNKAMVDQFVEMGFDIDRVVEAFMHFGLDRNGGYHYQMEEAYAGDIVARLYGEA